MARNLRAVLPRRLREALRARLGGPAPKRFASADKNAAASRIREAAARPREKPSALVFTIQKCASTFLSRLLAELAAAGGYRSMDYGDVLWKLGEELPMEEYPRDFMEANADLLFRRWGEIYGPLRTPLDLPDAAACRQIFFLRDPRDVAVSSYHSFGFSHALPLNPVRRAEFESKRARIRELGIDAHALEAGRNWLLPIYLRYAEMRDAAPARLFLSYDDFIADPAAFARRVAAFLEINLPEATAERLGREADPVQSGPPKSGHKRSGRSGQWREELRPETQAELTRILAPALERWGFG